MSPELGPLESLLSEYRRPSVIDTMVGVPLFAGTIEYEVTPTKMIPLNTQRYDSGLMSCDNFRNISLVSWQKEDL